MSLVDFWNSGLKKLIIAIGIQYEATQPQLTSKREVQFVKLASI
jgi:hypothetical protein